MMFYDDEEEEKIIGVYFCCCYKNKYNLNICMQKVLKHISFANSPPLSLLQSSSNYKWTI